MKDSFQGPRSTKPLSELFTRHINAYALAAGAAGVSLLALTQVADAEIVYTAANEVIPVNEVISLDLNHDGNPDMNFFIYTFAYHSFRANWTVSPAAGVGVVGAPNDAAALNLGNSIGAGREFQNHSYVVMGNSHGFRYNSSRYSRHGSGPWAHTQTRFLGVQFLIDGATHYGWVRIASVFGKFETLGGTITGYAYETIADKSIKAGQLSEGTASAPAEMAPIAEPSLGMLALGTGGLELWRRDDS